MDTSASGSTVTVNITDPLSVPLGGTGVSTLGSGQVLVGSGTDAVTTIDVTAKGSLLVGDGVVDPVAFPVGTDNYVLKADSTQSAGVNWEAESSGAGGFTYLSSVTASSSSSLEFSSYITSTYNVYLFVVSRILVETDGASFYLRTSADGGVTFDSGSADYNYSMYSSGLDDTAGEVAQIKLARNAANDTNGGTSFTGCVYMYNPSSTGLYKNMTYDICRSSQGAPSVFLQNAASQRRSSGIIDGVQFFASADDLVSGTISLYGMIL